jgi:hypothetical protein
MVPPPSTDLGACCIRPRRSCSTRTSTSPSRASRRRAARRRRVPPARAPGARRPRPSASRRRGIGCPAGARTACRCARHTGAGVLGRKQSSNTRSFPRRHPGDGRPVDHDAVGTSVLHDDRLHHSLRRMHGRYTGLARRQAGGRSSGRCPRTGAAGGDDPARLSGTTPENHRPDPVTRGGRPVICRNSFRYVAPPCSLDVRDVDRLLNGGAGVFGIGEGSITIVPANSARNVSIVQLSFRRLALTILLAGARLNGLASDGGPPRGMRASGRRVPHE